MDASKPVLRITAEQWNEKKARGQATLIDRRRYIVMMHETTKEPIYQPVAILEAGKPR